VLSYLRQVAICESVREMIRQALGRSDDWHTKLKASNIPTTESILRAVSVLPGVASEEQLKDFIIDHMLASLHITTIQKEDLTSNG